MSDNKFGASLTEHARVVIYACNMLTIQATDIKVVTDMKKTDICCFNLHLFQNWMLM
jgi:hypothetical protein